MSVGTEQGMVQARGGGAGTGPFTPTPPPPPALPAGFWLGSAGPWSPKEILLDLVEGEKMGFHPGKWEGVGVWPVATPPQWFQGIFNDCVEVVQPHRSSYILVTPGQVTGVSRSSLFTLHAIRDPTATATAFGEFGR